MRTQQNRTMVTGKSQTERFNDEMAKQAATRKRKANDPRERTPRTVKHRPTDAEVAAFVKKSWR